MICMDDKKELIMMKTLSLALIVLFSFSSFAAECEYVSEGKITNINFEYSKGISLKRSHVMIWNKYFGEKLSPLCQEDMSSSEIRDVKNRKLYYHRTHSDECDGGNFYGIIHDKKGKVVVEIQDGWAKCPQLVKRD